MGTMEWADHVSSFHSIWIFKYLHPGDSAWKRILDHMLYCDHKGNDIYGAGRSIVLC